MTIAIVGFGPRGLACLENLIFEFSNKEITSTIKILVFEPSDTLGTGKAWQIDQPETNYINISDHALQNLKGREKIVWNHLIIPGFKSYTQWCMDENKVENITGDKDVYPARSQMGIYLNQRAKSICEILEKENLLIVIPEKVVDVSFSEEKLKLTTSQETYNASECLLSLGHLPVKDSDETKKFKKHAARTKAVYIHDPYETVFVRDDLSQQTVAIKGFGLSMLDITRQLTNYKFGTFVAREEYPFLKFNAEKGCVSKILPYSFDGLPPVPKPFGRSVDQQFEPSLVDLNTFELALRNAIAIPESVNDTKFLLKSFAKVATPIFYRNRDKSVDAKQVEALVINWLQDPETSHEYILDTTLELKDYLVRSVQMAYGNTDFSLDFTIGQVWRHLQPSLYRIFAFSGLSGKLMKEIVDLDEATKRYSYGPPVESILQLIALVDANILDLQFANNPKVTLTKNAWKIEKNSKTIKAQMLCNSVMDAPVLSDINNKLINHLREKGLVTPVYEGLGIKTHPDAMVVSANVDEKSIPIAVIGRNAKGSVLGVDAILECFSPETHEWARGVVNRL